MYKIAICDDEATSLKLNRALTERILLEEDIPCEIVEFSCMDTMVAAVAKDEVSFDLLSTAKAAGILLLLFILVIFFIRITAPSRALPKPKP